VTKKFSLRYSFTYCNVRGRGNIEDGRDSEAQIGADRNRFLDFISSVRFGVSLLIALVVLCIVGMLIVQQNVNGFDAYFASLTPAEKLVYGPTRLFDIYHSWYFNLLLLVLSLNIVLASIDRFPSAWSYIVKPKHGRREIGSARSSKHRRLRCMILT
jgi:hypothetical protein